ncbi:MAG: baseplate J/gp47 family protein [Chloroflexota bacterium]|nr:baseplate J/gp47 family protein [Chloroflexota bacterium]
MNILQITPKEDRYTVRAALRHAPSKLVLIRLPWEVEAGWDSLLDYEVLLKTCQEEQLSLAWVVEDFTKRALPREAGFTVFASVEQAEDYLTKHDTFPTPAPPELPAQPQRPPWAEEPQPRVRPPSGPRPRWLLPVQLGILLIALVAIGAVTFLALPSAQIRLVPQQATYALIVPISVSAEMDPGTVDFQRNLIPGRRVGDEFESYAEVGTTGRGTSVSGKSRGQVVFTNQLGQNYQVPAGTVVRTSAGSYPVRFKTTETIDVPSFGQATAPVEALEQGLRGNVGTYQINFVEGVVGFALKVTNPDPITGAESQETATVSQADRDRAWGIAAEHVLAEANNGLQAAAYLQPGEFIPHQDLIIQATPKEAYTNLVGEQTELLGVSLRLLVTGLAVNANDAQKIAYRQLATQQPAGYRLTDTRFEIGESAEEDVGAGRFTFYVTAHGYATAEINQDAVWEAIQGQRAAAASTTLADSLPLAQPPEITISPHWFPYIPQLPIRTKITITPGKWSGE